MPWTYTQKIKTICVLWTCTLFFFCSFSFVCSLKINKNCFYLILQKCFQTIALIDWTLKFIRDAVGTWNPVWPSADWDSGLWKSFNRKIKMSFSSKSFLHAQVKTLRVVITTSTLTLLHFSTFTPVAQKRCPLCDITKRHRFPGLCLSNTYTQTHTSHQKWRTDFCPSQQIDRRLRDTLLFLSVRWIFAR